MILTTHAIAGAAIAQFFPAHPVLAFGAGFVSHFLLDTIPHWDYTLRSSKKDEQNPLSVDMEVGKDFFVDLVKIGFDIMLGVFASAFILGFVFGVPITTAAWLGMFGGMLPDFLQFAYMKWRREPLLSLQKFHHWIHSEKKLKQYPFSGILLQTLLVAVVVLASRLLLPVL